MNRYVHIFSIYSAPLHAFNIVPADKPALIDTST
jgi:hypothetical protein